MNINRFTADLWDWDVHKYNNDFDNFTSTQDGVTSLAADVGTSVAAQNLRRGLVRLTTGATDNNEAAVFTTQALWLYAANTAIYGRARVQWTEPATNTANVFVGFASSFGADLLVDNGAGVRTSGSIVGIYKVDATTDGTVWRAHARNGTTSKNTIGTTTAGGSAFQVFEIEIQDFDGTDHAVAYRVDGALLKDADGNVIRHRIVIASGSQMAFGVYAKTGSADSLVVDVDRIYAAQTR